MSLELTPDEKKREEEALAFSQENKRAIARRLTDLSRFMQEDESVSVFMADSPGAGKTEASIELLATVEADGTEILRIDPDDLRHEFPNRVVGCDGETRLRRC